jgi:hypothetical protein
MTARRHRTSVFRQIGSLVAFVVTALVAGPAQASTITLSGILNAEQVVDGGGSTSTATGFGVVTIDLSAFTITTDLSWSGLTGIADRAHLHDAPAGESRLDPPNGDFFHEVLNDADRTVPCDWVDATFTDCVPASGTTHDVLQLTGPEDGYGYPDFNSLIAAFVADGVYLDMHTEIYPSGEIRGQLTAVPEPSSFIHVGFGLIAIALLIGNRSWAKRPT